MKFYPFQKVLLGLFGLGFLVTVGIVVFDKVEDGSLVVNWMLLLWLFLGLVGLVGLVFLVTWLVSRKGKVVVDGIVRVPVSVRVARRLIYSGLLDSEEFGVPCVIVGGVVRPSRGVLFRLLDGRVFASSRTGNVFYAVEVFVSVGFYRGLTVFIIPLDRGEQGVRDNLFYRTYRHTTLSTWVSDFRKFALDSPSSEALRLAGLRNEALFEGADKDELASYDAAMSSLRGNGVVVDDVEPEVGGVVSVESGDSVDVVDSPEDTWRNSKK